MASTTARQRLCRRDDALFSPWPTRRLSSKEDGKWTSIHAQPERNTMIIQLVPAKFRRPSTRDGLPGYEDPSRSNVIGRPRARNKLEKLLLPFLNKCHPSHV